MLSLSVIRQERFGTFRTNNAFDSVRFRLMRLKFQALIEYNTAYFTLIFLVAMQPIHVGFEKQSAAESFSAVITNEVMTSVVFVHMSK